MGARVRCPAFARGVGELEMTVEVASRADPGERGSRCAGEAAAAPREPAPQEVAASQATLDALLCELLPRQGCWNDEDYLWLTDHGNRPVEFTDGFIEELPLPTSTHQAVLSFLYVLFRAWIRPRGGIAAFSALRMRIREGKFREPDILLLRDRSDSRYQDRYWQGADLVAEVVSPDHPDRDLVEKRADYAEAGIPEYWIADPRDETLTVLVLRGEAYVEHGRYGRGETAVSMLLEGFSAEVSAVFDAPETGG